MFVTTSLINQLQLTESMQQYGNITCIDRPDGDLLLQRAPNFPFSSKCSLHHVGDAPLVFFSFLGRTHYNVCLIWKRCGDVT